MICDLCKKDKKNVHQSRKLGVYWCGSCYLKYYREHDGLRLCSLCNKLDLATAYLPWTKIGTKNKDKNKPICKKCYHKYYIPKYCCSVCGQKQAVGKRTVDGKAICNNCYTGARRKDVSRHKLCSVCGRRKEVVKRTASGAICKNCYDRARQKDVSRYELCSVCCQEKLVAQRTEYGNTICKNCYNRVWRKDVSKYERCSICCQEKSVAKRNEDGSAVCKNCYNRENYQQKKRQA